MNVTRTFAGSLAGLSLALAGCVAVPVGPDGEVYVYPPGVVPVAAPAGGPGAGKRPITMQARLYPSNDIATRTGVVSGAVTNMMNGKGRFQLAYQGDTLVGEATAVDGDAHRGVASAYGAGGSYMSCEYQMYSSDKGAGTCTFSNGARYQLHIGG